MTILYICPFCQGTDFDLVGLKHHFISGHCEPFVHTPSVDQVRAAHEPGCDFHIWQIRSDCNCEAIRASKETGTAPRILKHCRYDRCTGDVCQCDGPV